MARRMRAREDVAAARSVIVARVLLCDDDRESTAALATELEKLGHAVTIARTCAEAFAIACAQDFEALVAVHCLRDGSALVLPSALGIRRPQLTVLLGRMADRLAPDGARRVGFDAQLTKVVDPRRLDRLFRAALAVGDTARATAAAEAEALEPAPTSEIGARRPH